MTIKIWHQSFTVLQDLHAYGQALNAHFAKVARQDTIIEMHGMRPGTFRTNYPGDDIKHAAIQYLHGNQFIAAALQAEKQGADAFAISTLPDPALREIRSLLSIPVVGYGESAMLTACMLGQRFGVLLFIEGMVELIAANAVRYGLSNRFGGAEFVGFQFTDVLEGFENPARLIDKFRTAARRMIEKGVDVIIPGEAPLSVLLAANGVSDVDGAAIVDPLATWVKHAEMLVDLKRQSGVTRSNRGYYGSRPSPDRMDEIMNFYRLNA